ncbi:hypothetical protein V2J09_022406 [Rumex salicifolius]
MWRRIVTSELQSLKSCSSSCRFASRLSSPALSRSHAAPSSFLSRHFSTGAENVVSKSNKRVEDVMPIATGHEREEIQAELEAISFRLSLI